MTSSSGSGASRWFASPHLARAEGGPQALAAFRRLSEAEQHEVLARGDRLAESSLALAQAYALQAPSARARLGREGFALWARLALEIAAERLGSRDAAAAYLRLDPARLAGAGRRLLEHWITLAADVQQVSRKLAVLYVEGSGAVLGELRGEKEERLDAWVRAGVRLAQVAGWRGEFLAAAYFGAGAAVLPVLAAEEIAAWAELGARVQSGREIQQGFFQSLPRGLEELSAAERQRLFSIATAVAAKGPKGAATLFAELPGAIARLGAGAREPVLRAFGVPDLDADGLVTLAPLVPALVGALPEPERPRLLRRAAATAERFPAALIPLLRSLPRARDEAELEGVLRWIARGEEILEENASAGRAYFALESRTSVRYLRESSAAVHLEEVQGVLRSYARMLSGQSLEVRAADGPSLRAFLDVESLGGSSFALPEKVDLFDSWEENFSILKLAAAGAVGRQMYGTFELSLRRVAERLPPPLAAVLATTFAGDSFAHFFEVVPEADPLVTLFAACEGARLDFRLARRYRGFGSELRGIARRLARRFPQRGRTPELVLFLLGTGLSARELATPALPASVLAEVATVLSSPSATVDDALAAAILIRERLGDSIAVSGFGPLTSYEELLFEKMTGETVLETEPEGAEADSKARPTEVLDLDPAAVEKADEDGRGTPLSAEELRRMLEAGAILKVGKSTGAQDSAGIFASGLDLPPGEGQEPGTEGKAVEAARRGRRGGTDREGFEYDEWDYEIRDYRPRWCHLDEITLAGDAGEFFQETLLRYADLLPEVRRQFQRLRPERYQTVRGLEDGEDFDLNAAVGARIDIRARRSPSPRLYVARRTEERDVATLFLLDMSASTDEALAEEKKGTFPFSTDADSAGKRGMSPFSSRRPRRIIDVTKEALVIMAEALEELGDRYAIYGFSGQGRDNVEFYRVKAFNEGLTARVRGRIGGIEPRRSTRMGAALRHALVKMASLPSRSKHVFLLSDGFPQDFDYGTDRRSNTYGIQDTMVALQECQAAGVTPFCITVDKTGHDYLRQMCETSRYLVIDDVAALPTELPKIYERWVRS